MPHIEGGREDTLYGLEVQGGCDQRYNTLLIPLRTHGVGVGGLVVGLDHLHLVVVLAGLFVLIVERMFAAGTIHASRCGRTVIVVRRIFSINWTYTAYTKGFIVTKRVTGLKTLPGSTCVTLRPCPQEK